MKLKDSHPVPNHGHSTVCVFLLILSVSFVLQGLQNQTEAMENPIISLVNTIEEESLNVLCEWVKSVTIPVGVILNFCLMFIYSFLQDGPGKIYLLSGSIILLKVR